MPSEFPKTFYRYDAESGAKLGKTFASADEVEPGWVEHDALGPAPVIKKKAEPPASAVEAGKRLVAAERELMAAKDTLKLYEDNAALDAAKLEASQARVAEIEKFLKVLAEDENCPEALKEEIGALFEGSEEEAPAKGKRRAKA